MKQRFKVDTGVGDIEIGKYLMQGNVFRLKLLDSENNNMYLSIKQGINNELCWEKVAKNNSEVQDENYLADQSNLFCAVPLDPQLRMEIDLIQSMEKYLYIHKKNKGKNNNHRSVL